MANRSVSEALTRQLKALCLKSFPCGTGSWNKSSLLAGKGPTSDWVSTDPEEDNQDSLKDLLVQHGSPWELDDSCSPEAQHIRDLAVTCPDNITEEFIYSYFRTLRVVDQEITEADADLLKFCSLEELVLSANRLTTVNSSNLPRTLKVLELCSNHISNLTDLTVSPPPDLQHLGLAYNKLQESSISSYLTADFWPNLVSLDLSFNNLTDLFDLIPKLCTLLQLRILALQGNPLTFTPSYRGYTVDSLHKLCVLDDISILPDERHKSTGLLKNKESLSNEAKLFVHVGKVQGIPNPSTSTELQNAGEYPITTISYHVCYEFVKDQPCREESQCHKCKNLHMITTEGSVQLLCSHNSAFHTDLYKTGGSHWDEVINYEYEKEHTVADLLALKYFLLYGMNVTVVEEKILSWPHDAEQNPTTSKIDKKGGGKDKEKDKARNSSRGSKAGSKNKKKKDNLEDLCHDPPVVRTLGSMIMPLKSLVSGDLQTFTVCNFGTLYSDKEEQHHSSDKGLQENKKVKEQRQKSGRESVETHKTSRSSAKEKHKDVDVKSMEDETHPVPIPFTVEIAVRFLH
ncbi:leucine-rich repeat-containing protein 43 isoform X1 [Hyperolius riggenbachi]|uniref:leucine-rich repeat-containing protein 43 isoform X1 n=1 Tax=Hyperolius riggenbachi TaxID=752182 RepID=UPI0035A2EE26